MHDRKSLGPLRLFGWFLVGLFIVFFLLLPTIRLFTDASLTQTSVSSSEIDDQSTSDRVLLYATSFFATVSFLAIGAAVGSYLNVIVYRVPRKISLTFTRSGCPKCGAPIHLSDNIPIISWCRLKGRCRACQAPISVRYPLVEISVAVIFLTLYFRELLSGGTNIPVRPPNLYTGVLWILFYTKWDLVGLYLLHCFLLTTILGWGLINADGFRVPRSSLRTTLLIVCVAILISPDLMPVQLKLSLTQSLYGSDRIQALISSLCGILSGALLGSFLTWIVKKEWLAGSSQANAITYAFILCGAIYGSQSMPVITLIAFIFILLQRMITHNLKYPVLKSPPIAAFLAIFSFQFFWGSLTWL
ncbi:Leader peptidase PppA [Gimesia maris]|uniref:A24 family peptidase n=1 Tax=Gimesia maris TaxID=122 RepID=UPI001189BF9C|nr:prepilin peptidase [Gimesia maris]QDU16217.1 Leader peptidase PppA [Gimesia maris]